MRIIKVVLGLIIICILAGIGFLYLAPEKATKLAIDIERSRKSLCRANCIMFIWKAVRASR
jgi:hypothetical protein